MARGYVLLAPERRRTPAPAAVMVVLFENRASNTFRALSAAQIVAQLDERKCLFCKVGVQLRRGFS
jgi:hypothetical protein